MPSVINLSEIVKDVLRTITSSLQIPTIIILLLLILLKPVATATTIGSGGVGGSGAFIDNGAFARSGTFARGGAFVWGLVLGGTDGRADRSAAGLRG